MRIDPVLKEELKEYLLVKIKNKQKPRVTIRASYKLSEEEVSSLKKRIQILDEAEILLEQDPQLLAGFVIQFNSRIIDLSLNSELQSLKHKLYETA